MMFVNKNQRFLLIKGIFDSFCHHIRSSFFSKHLKLELPVPTTAFVNIMKLEGDEWSKDII